MSQVVSAGRAHTDPTNDPGQLFLPRDQVLDLGNFCGLQAKIGDRKIRLHVLGVSVSSITSVSASNRIETRREAVLEEANAIGTTYLRARLLPDPHRTEVAKLLREYVAVRLSASEDSKLEEVIARSEALREQLWSHATAVAEEAPNPITALFVQSLNEVIDVHAKRVQVGLRSRIPMSIWCGLFGLAFVGMAAIGYQAGLSDTRRSPAMLLLVLAFAGVLFLTADLDRGQNKPW